ncbi:MAG: MFS transporter [Coleofasciculus sp. S288]|nr:MFS transporter [Coleofasciculus sp. S288]
MQVSTNRTAILWQQVWGLAALLAAILFSFMAYGLYQPTILKSLGFVELATWLGIVQGFLGAVLEPLVGGLSDRIMRRVGCRLPMISVGVTLAGLLFVVLALLIQGNLPNGVRWLVPVLMTVWVMAMIVFRGPAIALLIQFAPLAELPKASAILIFVLGLVGALGPLLGVLFQRLGASPTFILGAIALVIGALRLYSTTPKHSLVLPEENTQLAIPFLPLILLFGVGMGAGLEINVLLGIVPQILTAQLGGIRPEYIASGILLVSALAAIPLGELSIKLGVNRAMLLGLGAIAGLMGLSLLNRTPIPTLGLILALGATFGLVFISQIPFALSKVPLQLAGLGTGSYFGGMGAATALASILIVQLGKVTPTAGALWTAIAFLFAALCIAFSSIVSSPASQN